MALQPGERLGRNDRADVARQSIGRRRPAVRASPTSASPACGRRCRPADKARATPSSAVPPNRTRKRARRSRPVRRARNYRRSARSGRRSPRSAESARRRGRGAAASEAAISRATSVDPVNMTPATWGLRGERGADRAVAGQQPQRVGGNARLVHQPHGLDRDQRRLLGRLGDDRIAGRERRGDLTGEDRDREIPRADAGDDRRAG